MKAIFVELLSRANDLVLREIDSPGALAEGEIKEATVGVQR